eukprot:TRINITY_DN8090_c0_g1_i1.p1 TRINITY_DN8090_c0_g1~~TRINITY_DN8090_c0_g1_i1.p1  ORF type:complete len:267 (+),score=54.00 TRINITY_DN8090_c0_g1_i1:108-908(+)
MEDAHITDGNFGPDQQLYAIFDGHGGPEVAKYCGKHFGRVLKENKNYQNGNYEAALKEAFLTMDELLVSQEGQKELKTLKNDNENQESYAGCTANVTFVNKDTLYVANAGDSRCYLYGSKKVTELSFDHKPDNEIEKNRISKAGGFVLDGRVNGNLNLSRAIGDLEYKKNPALKPQDQIITADPDVVKRELNLSTDEFFIMGCDGVWELLTAEEICSIADEMFRSNANVKVSQVVETILDRGLSPDTSTGIGCDNMSALIVKFKRK